MPSGWPPWLDKILREKLRRYRRPGPVPPDPDPWAALHERARVELLPRLEALAAEAGSLPGSHADRLALRAGEIVDNVLRR